MTKGLINDRGDVDNEKRLIKQMTSIMSNKRS